LMCSATEVWSKIPSEDKYAELDTFHSGIQKMPY